MKKAASRSEPITNEVTKSNYRPYSEYILSEASNYINISGVPLSVANRISLKKGEQEKSLCSVQLNEDELTQIDETVISRVGKGILDYLFDTCNSLGYYPNWEFKFQSPKNNKYNLKLFAKHSTWSMVWFDNGIFNRWL